MVGLYTLQGFSVSPEELILKNWFNFLKNTYLLDNTKVHRWGRSVPGPDLLKKTAFLHSGLSPWEDSGVSPIPEPQRSPEATYSLDSCQTGKGSQRLGYSATPGPERDAFAWHSLSIEETHGIKTHFSSSYPNLNNQTYLPPSAGYIIHCRSQPHITRPPSRKTCAGLPATPHSTLHSYPTNKTTRLNASQWYCITFHFLRTFRKLFFNFAF